MRILIYGLNFAPELVGIGKYTGELTEWLAACGHQVRVVTAPPYYPAWTVSNGWRSYSYSREQMCSANVTRCPLWVPAKPSGLRRIFHLASFAISSLPVVWWQALTWRPNILFSIAPALFCAPGAWVAARFGGSSACLHIQDLELDAAFELGLISAPVARDLCSAIERFLLQRFDLVSSISRRMLEQIRSKGVPGSSLYLFPNWVDTERIFPTDRNNGLRNEWGIAPEKIVALYSGNMEKSRGSTF